MGTKEESRPNLAGWKVQLLSELEGSEAVKASRRVLRGSVMGMLLLQMQITGLKITMASASLRVTGALERARTSQNEETDVLHTKKLDIVIFVSSRRRMACSQPTWGRRQPIAAHHQSFENTGQVSYETSRTMGKQLDNMFNVNRDVVVPA